MSKRQERQHWTSVEQKQAIGSAMAIATTANLLLALRRSEPGKHFTDLMVEQAGMDRDLCDGGTKYILIPMLPFAVELCLKALKAQGGNEFIKTHNLKCLWEDLSKEEQDQVREYMQNPERIKHEVRQRQACGITTDIRTVDQVIETHKNDFNDWRYVVDGVKRLTEKKKAINLDEAFLDFFRIVSACLECHKERGGRDTSGVTRKDQIQMSDRIIPIAKTGVVERGGARVMITKESIEPVVEQINEGPAIPVTVDHDPFVMPIGKVKEAWIESFGDEHVVRGRIHLEENPSGEVHSATGTVLIRLDFSEIPKAFVKKAYGKGDKSPLELSIDLANFSSMDDYARFADEVRLIDDSIVCDNGLGRHSLTPEPFIEFIVSNPEIAAILAWILRRFEKFARHTADETFKKVGDYVSGVLSTRIVEILRAYRSHKSEDDRAIVIQIISQGEPEVCLLVKIESDEDFPTLCLKKIVDELEEYRDVLADASRIVLSRVGTDGWKFLYATTQSGEVIGTEECYNKTLDSIRNLGKDPQI